MKNKLTAKIALKYYKTKFKAISLISSRKAADRAFQMFCTPHSGKPGQKEPVVFHKAEKLSFELKGVTIRGWRWNPDPSNGKKILIAHGFDSCSYRFDKYIPLLKLNGFEVLAFDAPGHGISDGKTINALVYRDMILSINQLFGDLYGVMAHSLGGLAAVLAAEEMKELQKLVLIAPAAETERAINNFFSMLALNDEVRKEFRDWIPKVSQKPISFFSISRAIQHISANTLWLHDTEDITCPFEDVVPVQEMKLSNVQFL